MTYRIKSAFQRVVCAGTGRTSSAPPDCALLGFGAYQQGNMDPAPQQQVQGGSGSPACIDAFQGNPAMGDT